METRKVAGAASDSALRVSAGPVLITGGLGFLGGHLVRALLDDGFRVRVLARSRRRAASEGEDETGVAYGGSVEIVWGDIREPAVVREAADGCEAVIHLVSNFRSARSDGQEAYDINVGGTENMLAAAEQAGVRQIIHCSTIGVHGSVAEIPANEETAFNPGDSYQETKLIGERKVWEHYRRTDQPVTVIRPISMFGPGDRRMLKLFKMISAGWFIRMGEGHTYFQPAYVSDVVKGFRLCLGNDQAVGEVFIIGGDEYLTLNQLAAVIGEELGVKWRTLSIPMTPVLGAALLCERAFAPLGIEPPLHSRRVSFYRNHRAFTIEKARRVLGYEPEVSLRQCIRRTIAFYREAGWL